MLFVSAFRTYAWNSEIRELAIRFFRSTAGTRQVILADETRGSLHIDGFEVISHTEDTSKYDLIKHPSSKSLWYNVDYGAYILRKELPEYDYYVLSESDLAVNADLTSMLADVAENEIDFVAHGVQRSTPDWYWHENATQTSAEPWRSLLFFMVFSARAIDSLYAERRALGRSFLAGETKTWSFCEPFVPSVLFLAKMRFRALSYYVDTVDLNFRPRLSIDDPKANRPGSLAHSVLGVDAFMRAVIAEGKRGIGFCIERSQTVAGSTSF